jgi:TatA/E family protein of Tat protein translocase
MPTPGPLELVIILVIALLILGPGRLPDVGSALGKGLREFRKASSDIQDGVKVDTSPLPPEQPAAGQSSAAAAAPVATAVAATPAPIAADSPQAAPPPSAPTAQEAPPASAPVAQDAPPDVQPAEVAAAPAAGSTADQPGSEKPS